MDTLKSHYGRLLGLDASWIVTNVDLNLAQKQVVIALEYVGRGKRGEGKGVRTH